jgi:hypothetical protein
VPAFGAAVTVTVLVAVALAHPPVPVTVYVIVAVPGVNPLIKPVAESTEATPVFELVHVPPDTVELNVVVPPTHIACVPLKVPALGAALTVTVLVEDAAGHVPAAGTV